MSMKKRVIILVVSLIIVTGIIVGVSYAFFSIGGSQETANTFQSGCLNISLTDASASISLSNIYPITDIEGLNGTSYDFTITNTCNTDANYQINLESLNQVSNSLSADYIKVSLSSDTVGNVISILSDNTSVTPEVANAYEAYNLYTGTLEASETKTYHLKLWLDYDATVEQAANKVYSSKINVVANPEIQVVDTLEATFELNNKTLTSNLTNNVTSATYCVTTDNICTPSTTTSIQNNSYTVELQGNKNKQMVCTRLNGTSKIICSDTLEIAPTYLAEVIKRYNQSTRTDFSTTMTEETTNTVYTAQDDDGTTYYFAGAPADNWVYWAGFYWRIIRINGDGTIRLIYNGTSANATGTGTQLANTSAFNSSYNNNAYVGLKYTTNNVHGTGTNSTILTALNNWYTSSGLSSYADDLDGNAGFCGDRTPSTSSSSSNGSGGTGTTYTYYAGYVRLYGNSSGTPTYKCSNSGDLYTVSGSSKGNKSLTYPIGLITMDEAWYAGGYSARNSSYWLYTGQNYWTMSPFYFLGSAHVFIVESTGYLYSNRVNGTKPGVRPVVNLKADVTITSGDGTADNPYVIAT